MAHRDDWRMLNDSISNLGNSFVINRQMAQQEQDRTADRELRQRLMDEHVAQRREAAEANATARADALKQRSEPRISAFIADPDNPEQGVSAEGTWESIQQIVAETAKNKGKAPLVMPKPPGAAKGIDQTFTIGGVKITTHDPAHSKIIEDKLKAAGIDPYAEKPKGQFETSVTHNANALTKLQDDLEAAQTAGDTAAVSKAQRALNNFQSLAQRTKPDEPDFGTETTTVRTGSDGVEEKSVSTHRKLGPETLGVGGLGNKGYEKPGRRPAARGDARPTGSKKPTRAKAAEYVTKFGQANAKAKLTADGFDVSGYAD